MKGEGGEERIVGDDIPVRGRLEDLTGAVGAAAFGVAVDEIVDDESVAGEPRCDDSSMG